MWFRGYVDSPTRTNDSGRQGIAYKFHNVWWLFERLAFVHRAELAIGLDEVHDLDGVVIRITVTALVGNSQLHPVRTWLGVHVLHHR